MHERALWAEYNHGVRLNGYSSAVALLLAVLVVTPAVARTPQALDDKVLDLKPPKFHHVRHDPFDAASLCHPTVWSLCLDGSGMLWVGTMGGFDRYDEESGTFQHFSHEAGNPSSFSASQPTTCGLLWA